MRTTIDLPDELLEQSKIVAAKRKTSLKKLVINGLKHELAQDASPPDTASALARLKTGFHLGGKPLTRADAHER